MDICAEQLNIGVKQNIFPMQSWSYNLLLYTIYNQSGSYSSENIVCNQLLVDTQQDWRYAYVILFLFFFVHYIYIGYFNRKESKFTVMDRIVNTNKVKNTDNVKNTANVKKLKAVVLGNVLCIYILYIYHLWKIMILKPILRKPTKI